MLLWIVIRPVVGQDVVGVLEEVVVALEAEVLESLDGHDAVDGVGELLPAAQQYLVRAGWCPRVSSRCSQ